MVYITGDTHGEINRFSNAFLPDESEWTENDYLLICGDFGFVFFDNEREKMQLDMLEKKPYNILFADGNHALGQGGRNQAAVAVEGLVPDGGHLHASCDFARKRSLRRYSQYRTSY